LETDVKQPRIRGRFTRLKQAFSRGNDMKLIQDFTQFDTPKLFRALRSFKRTLIGVPVIMTIPSVGIIALRPDLWWLFPLYVIAILLGFLVLGTAYGRLVAEIENRMKD